MSKNSTWWLAAGALCFGLGIAGGRGLKGSEPSTATTDRPPPSPLRSATASASASASGSGSGSAALQFGPVEHPQIAERLATLDRIANIGLDELPDLVRELVAARVDQHDVADLLPAIDRWVELDPAGGFEFFSSQFPDRPDVILVTRFSVQWALVDAAAAIEAAKQSSNSGLSQDCLYQIVTKLASERPAEYFKHWEAFTSHSRGYVLSEAAQRLAETDPRAMLEFFPRLNDTARHGVIGDLAFGWAKKNPQAALAWARGLDDESDRSRALRAISSRLAETDPDWAAAVFADATSPVDPDKSLQWTVEGGYIGRDFNWRSIANRIAVNDPLAALRWVQRHGKPSEMARAVTNYLPTSASAAVDYLARLPAEMVPDTFRSPGLHWRPADPDTGLAKLGDIADPDLRESARSWLLVEIARQEPLKAIATAQEQIASENKRLPVIETGMRHWAKINPTNASVWLSQQPPGGDLDAGILGLVEATHIADPQAAIEWASAISDPDSRSSSLSFILQHQPVGWAREALEKVELQPHERTQLEERLRSRESGR